MAKRTYTVVTHEAGKPPVETVHEMSPEMERICDEQAAFHKKHPDFWCKCGEVPTEELRIEPRGHSVDVFHAVCGGCIQVG